MEGLTKPEYAIALVGAIVVGVTALIALKNDWKQPGLDMQVTKILLALMAAGCVLVIYASTVGFGKGA